MAPVKSRNFNTAWRQMCASNATAELRPPSPAREPRRRLRKTLPTAGRGSRRVCQFQSCSRIAEHDIVPGIVARHPPIRHHRSRHRIRHRFAILNQRKKTGRKNTPSLIEDVERIANSTSLQQPDERIAERLHHRLTRVGLERIGPGAIDVADDGLRALQQHFLRQAERPGCLSQSARADCSARTSMCRLWTSRAVASEEEVEQPFSATSDGTSSAVRYVAGEIGLPGPAQSCVRMAPCFERCWGSVRRTLRRAIR